MHGQGLKVHQQLEQKPLDMTLIRWMFGYTRPYSRLRNALFCLVLLRACQLPAISWAVAYVISGPIANGEVQDAVLAIAAFAVLVVVTEVCFMYRMRLALTLGEFVVFDMRSQIFAHLMKLPMSFFNKMPLGTLISRMTSDVDTVRVGIQEVFFVSVVQLGSMVIAATLMLYYDWFLFLLVCALVPILWGLIRFFRDRLRQAYRDVQETYSRLTSTLAESVNGIRVIQGFVRQRHNEAEFRDLIGIHSHNNMETVRYSSVFVPLLDVNGQVFLAVLLVVGGYEALGGDINLGTLIQFFFLSNLLFSPIPILGGQYNQALTAMAGAERVYDILNHQPEWQDDPAARDVSDVVGEVEFDDVSFGYDPDKLVLQDISFVARPGQTIALVGETGSGKTTVTRLLSKLYLPRRGRVLLDGVDTRDITSRSIHEVLGTVPQDNFLFPGTVRDNIRFGRPSASDREVKRVLGELGLEDLMSEMPKGLDTDVGEKGGNLSLGQRQLVCFARALLKDPRLLILDEATSSVDAVTEERLQGALKRLLKGRTSFVVAHRLSTIQSADLILVLEAGRIVERGTHDELFARGGQYAKLYRAFVRGRELAPAS